MAARKKKEEAETESTTEEKVEAKAEEKQEVTAADLGVSDSSESKKAQKKEIERKKLIEDRLAAFKDFAPNIADGFGARDDILGVGHVPADMVTTWATDPRIDKGQCISLFRSLGFTPVRPEEVTTNDYDDNRLLVHNYEEYNNMVCRGGGVLMIGYRQYRDERKAYARIKSRERIDAATSNVEDMERSERTGFATGGSWSS